MELQTLANIGEFLGGGAVLVSLIYLVVSLRQNTSQLRENAKVQKLAEMRATYAQHDRYRQLLVSSREVAELVSNTFAGDSPDPVDQVRFDNFTYQLVYSVQHQWQCVQEGVIDAAELQRVLPPLATALMAPGGQSWWKRNRAVLNPGYVAAVEAHFDEPVID
ncbi:MAG: hypothetical protein AAGI88_15690 [Pseudomonadota bacterium]